MQTYRLKISEEDFSKLKQIVFADLPNEGAAFLLAGFARGKEHCDIIVRRILEIPSDAFRVRNAHHLEIAPQAINGLAALCQANGLGAVLCHSHPADFSYSSSDDFGEGRVFAAIRPFLSAQAPTASLLLTPNTAHARAWLQGRSAPLSVSEVVVVGRCIRKLDRKSVV